MNSFVNQWARVPWHRYAQSLAILGLVILLGCNGCNPGQPNLGYICTVDVPGGQSYTFEGSNGGPASVNFIGRVYYSTLDSNCSGFTDSTLHPLVVFAHGRYTPGVPNNYLGITNLMNHLASWGYICISVNMDVVSSLQSEAQWGIPHRGELMLHAIKYMASECRRPASPFYQRVDTTKIGLIGHSRGGGGAIYACNYNVSSMKNWPIKAVATISPVDFGTLPLQVAVPHMSLYGSWDGDLSTGHGPKIWNAGARMAPKELVEIYGANHFHFTDAIVYDNNEISREAHHELAQGYINAWFDQHIRGLSRYEWPDYLTGQKKVQDTVGTYISYLHHQFQSIDNGGPLGTPLVNTLTGANTGTGLTSFTDFTLNSPPDYSQGQALQLGWDGNADKLSFQFPTQNAGAFSHLSFRVSQVAGNPANPVDAEKDFRVSLHDVSGGSDTISISQFFQALQYPDLSGSLTAVSPHNRKQLMRSYRIPLASFASVNLAQVNQVQLLFSHPNAAGQTNQTGQIKVDDLEFSN